MNVPDRNTLQLTHFGRRSGKRFQAKIWYVLLDGEVWIGSMDVERNWVRNLTATGRGEVDFGNGPVACSCERIRDETALAGFRAAILAKYPILSRVVALLVRTKRPGAFRLNFNAQDPPRTQQ